MYYYKKGTALALHLCGTRNAERFYFRIKDYYNISCFLTDDIVNSNSQINNIPLYNFKEYIAGKSKNKEKIIFVTTRPEQQSEKIIFLKDKGYEVIDDFIFSAFCEENHVSLELLFSLFQDENELVRIVKKLANGRKICILNGNCQIGAIKQYLTHCKKFTNDYLILDIPLVYNINSTNIKIFDSKKVFDICDLIISQPISDKNKFSEKASNEYLFNIVNIDCKKVLITKASFTGYHIQYTNAVNNLSKVAGKAVITYGDKFINEFIERGYSRNIISELLKSRNLLSEKQIRENFDYAFKKSFEMERECDVKIMDFVYENYKNEILYYSFNHPKDKVIKYLAVRLLEYLGYKNAEFYGENFIEALDIMSNQQQPVYPCVYDYLGIEYKNENVIYTEKNNMANYAAMSFSEYIEFYCNLYNKPVTGTEKKTISIFGCCASREMFNYSDKFIVNTYIMRNPLSTLFSPALNLNENIKCENVSDFLNRMLRFDFNKTALTEFFKITSDYCLIDFGDMRYDYYEFQSTGACISKNAEATKVINRLCASDRDGKLKYTIHSIKEITEEEVDCLINLFCDRLLANYAPSQIILNRIHLARKYVPSQGPKCEICNFPSDDWTIGREDIIKKFEDKFITRIPDILILDFPDENLMLSDERHYLGNKHPFHWIPEIYDAKIRYLASLLDEENDKAFEEIKKNLIAHEFERYSNIGGKNNEL